MRNKSMIENFVMTQYHPQEIIETLSPFIIEKRKQRLRSIISNRSLSVTPVLENLHDAHNINAIIRTAEHFGLQEIHVLASDKLKPSKGVDGGSRKWIDFQNVQSISSCIHKLKKRNYTIYATSVASSATPLSKVDPGKKAAIIFGNEKDGVTKEALSMSDHIVHIPNRGFAESLNVSVAAGIIIQDFVRKIPTTPLTDERKLQLLARYYSLSVTHSDKILKKLIIS